MSTPKASRPIFLLQLASVAAMWVFVVGISYWIVHLLVLSHRLHDVPSASVGISIVAIPVFLTGAGVLTYVFFGLRRGARPVAEGGAEGEVSEGGGGGARLLLALALLPLLAAPELSAGDLALPDNPLRGRLLFESKRCHECHGIAGTGTGIGPDLAGSHYSGSFLDLGAALWNHVPGMSASFEETGASWPQLTEREVTDLLAFLYFLDYLGRPGDAGAGRRLFLARGCAACHSVAEVGGGSVGPDLSELERFASPLFIAQAIWNHGPAMFETMRELRMSAPRFDEGDLADLSAFLRQRGRAGPVERVLLAPGSPNRGAGLFEAKGCAICHGRGAHGGDSGPDLHAAQLHRSAEGIAGTMWNHARAMSVEMRARGLGWPNLTTEELADLIAYLYYLPFVDPAGDRTRGAGVFAARSCAECHDPGEGAAAGPELFGGRGTASSAAFVAEMWNHAPVMRETIVEQGRPWPELSGQELRDLLALLRSGDSD